MKGDELIEELIKEIDPHNILRIAGGMSYKASRLAVAVKEE